MRWRYACTRAQSLPLSSMTRVCAVSHLSLAAHHRPVSAGDRSGGGVRLERLRLNSARVMMTSPPPLRLEAARRLLDHRAEREQRLLIERPADELQAERQTVG